MDAALDRTSGPGTVLGIAGVVLLFAPMAINAHPARPDEMRRLADEHNRALRRRLAGQSINGGKGPGSTVVTALPYAAPGGGGLVVRATF